MDGSLCRQTNNLQVKMFRFLRNLEFNTITQHYQCFFALSGVACSKIFQKRENKQNSPGKQTNETFLDFFTLSYINVMKIYLFIMVRYQAMQLAVSFAVCLDTKSHLMQGYISILL